MAEVSDRDPLLYNAPLEGWICLVKRDQSTVTGQDQLRHLLIDKTGTLTRGKPSVIEAVAADGVDEPELRALAHRSRGRYAGAGCPPLPMRWRWLVPHADACDRTWAWH